MERLGLLIVHWTAGARYSDDPRASAQPGEPLSCAKKPGEDQCQNARVVAIDVSAFTDPRDDENLVDQFVDGLKSLARAGENPVMVPGEREEAYAELGPSAAQNASSPAEACTVAFDGRATVYASMERFSSAGLMSNGMPMMMFASRLWV